MSNILLCSKIDNITENKTIKPPIIIIVLKLFIMLSERIVPKLERVNCFLVLWI